MNVRRYGNEHTPGRTRVFVPNFNSNLDIVTIFSTLTIFSLFSVKHGDITSNIGNDHPAWPRTAKIGTKVCQIRNKNYKTSWRVLLFFLDV